MTQQDEKCNHVISAIIWPVHLRLLSFRFFDKGQLENLKKFLVYFRVLSLKTNRTNHPKIGHRVANSTTETNKETKLRNTMN